MFPYDVNGRVPLAIRHPGREPAVTDVPASLVDLLPTLLKAVELLVAEAAMGIDLFAAVDAEDTDRLIFAESGYEDEPQVSVRRNGWKLIHIPSNADRKRLSGGPYELYDTDEDPLKERNLAGQGLAVESALAESLAEWRAKWDEDSLSEVRPPEVSQETWDQLRALGYVHTREQVFAFLEHLERATIVSSGDDSVIKTAFAVAGKIRPVLFEHPDSEVSFHDLTIYSNSTLEIGIGINEEVWDRGGDGVQFEIIVNDSQSVERTVYSRYIDPKNRVEDRKWIDEVLDLRPFAGEVVTITFRTSSGPSSSKLYDWSGWSEPKMRR